MAYQNITVLGNAGSGKSTLARRLGDRLGLKVVHLDVLFWSPGWIPTELEVFRARVREALAGGGCVCEGNYATKTFDLRLPTSDLIIWMDIPRLVCLRRIVKRVSSCARPDLPVGCSDQYDLNLLELMLYVWQFERNHRPRIEDQRIRFGPQIPVIRVKDAGAIEGLIRDLQKGSGRSL